MATCPKCGAKIKEDDKFCPYCGISLATKTKVEERYTREGDTCFGEGGRRQDYSGLVSFGIFLLILGIVFMANPNVASDLRLWVEQLVREKTLLRPPRGLITSATLFFGLIGLSNFFVAGIRFFVYESSGRALTDLLSGVALVLFSYLIYLYGGYALKWQIVLAIEAVVCGLLVMAYGAIRYLFYEK